jgi:peptide/nickel transport system substrate-binding protein
MTKGEMKMNNHSRLALFILVFLLLAGCQGLTEVDIPINIQPQLSPTVEVIEPTPLPPEKTLIVCLQREPESLYIYSEDFLYGDTGLEANAILQALYDGPIDILKDGVRPVILEGLPSFDSGSARFETVEVDEFEVYLNPETLLADNLRLGDPYLPAGCRSPECIQTYQGGLVTMDRMVVDFDLREDVSWSDGELLTADDSVFSFELDRDGNTPTTKYLVDRTFQYEALDDQTVRWTGIPGYADFEYQTLFWHPLPRHHYDGLSAKDLQSAQEANREPVGWGAFMLERWVKGDRIEMVRNPVYFQQVQGLPTFDRLIFRFLGADPRAAVQQLLTTECDVLDETLLSMDIWSTLVEYQSEGRLQLFNAPSGEITRLEFNNAPLGRPGEAFFQASEARQAVAACIDRERLVETSMAGLGSLASSFHFFNSTISAQDGETYAYDPQLGQELLRFLGWVDEDEDPETALVGWDVPGVYNGKRFEVTLLVPDGDLYAILGQEIQAMLSECGILVTLEMISTESLTASYPDGSAFGRSFDMVLWSWPDWRLPLCEMFATREIPSDRYPYGVNASGFSNATYDLACDRLILGDFEHEQESLDAIQTTFHEQLPTLPLIQNPRLLVASGSICGFELDPYAPSLLWRVEAIAGGPDCE